MTHRVVKVEADYDTWHGLIPMEVNIVAPVSLTNEKELTDKIGIFLSSNKGPYKGSGYLSFVFLDNTVVTTDTIVKYDIE